MNLIKNSFLNIHLFISAISFFTLISLFLSTLLTLPIKAAALNEREGEQIFIKNCAGCHIKGGNIIRRNKTLKEKDLIKNGIETPEAIAKIAREVIGIMSGYEDLLGEEGDEIVANWIWEQSQKAWIQG